MTGGSGSSAAAHDDEDVGPRSPTTMDPCTQRIIADVLTEVHGFIDALDDDGGPTAADGVPPAPGRHAAGGASPRRGRGRPGCRRYSNNNP